MRDLQWTKWHWHRFATVSVTPPMLSSHITFTNDRTRGPNLHAQMSTQRRTFSSLLLQQILWGKQYDTSTACLEMDALTSGISVRDYRLVLRK
jgi:hypothetical protein